MRRQSIARSDVSSLSVPTQVSVPKSIVETTAPLRKFEKRFRIFWLSIRVFFNAGFRWPGLNGIFEIVKSLADRLEFSILTQETTQCRMYCCPTGQAFRGDQNHVASVWGVPFWGPITVRSACDQFDLQQPIQGTFKLLSSHVTGQPHGRPVLDDDRLCIRAGLSDSPRSGQGLKQVSQGLGAISFPDGLESGPLWRELPRSPSTGQ